MRGTPATTISNDIGETTKQTSLKWTGNYIYGTLINNLNTINAFDEEILSGDIGSIQKIIFTSKVSDYGNVLIIIGETDTLSVYINETILTDTEGSENVQQSTKFIGTIRELRGSYGTTHPESVAEHKGEVYWWDESHKAVIRYTKAGLHPISDYGFRSYFKNVDSSDIKMFGGYDPLTESYMLTVPSFGDIEYIEYPDDWDGEDTCSNTLTDTWGDSFSILWDDYTCIKTFVRTYRATWGDRSCLQGDKTWVYVTWDDYTCVKQNYNDRYRAIWDDFLCTQQDADFNTFWGDYTCIKVNEDGSWTAEWQSKICVDVTT